jgi:hypothetical protein
MAIGEELLDVPFAEMVRNLAGAIAEGQLALDRSAVETLRFLLDSEVDVVPEITEVIESTVRQVEVNGQQIPVTGINVRASGAAPVRMNLVQAGLLPTFYQFTEAVIEVKLSISIKRTEERSTSPGGESAPSGPLARARVSSTALRAFASPVNYRTANTFSYSAQGSSTLRAILRPVPMPVRVTPRTVTVNTLTTPPTVTVTE